MTACDNARRLLLEGESPTGYGAPLTPLPPEEAQAILAPIDRFLERLRDFVAELAPAELATQEAVQPPENTRVWASNLIERLRQIADDLAPGRLRRYGFRSPEELEAAERLRQDLHALVASALSASRSSSRQTSR